MEQCEDKLFGDTDKTTYHLDIAMLLLQINHVIRDIALKKTGSGS